MWIAPLIKNMLENSTYVIYSKYVISKAIVRYVSTEVLNNHEGQIK
jgi:hypothetical protein